MSRLNHRFIVRYYTTWVETSNALPSNLGSESEDSEQTDVTNGRTSKPRRGGGSSGSDGGFNGHFTTFDIKDLDSVSTSRHSTFPSIHFARSNSQQDDNDNDNDNDNGSSSDDGLFEADGEEDEEDGDDPFGWSDDGGRGRPVAMSGSGFLRKSMSPPAPRKTLYIQMVSVLSGLWYGRGN